MSYELRVTRDQSGMAAILTVVIVGAAVLIMAKSVALLSIDDVMMSAGMNSGEAAMTIAGGCAEETLRRLQLDPGYAADDFILPLGGGECVTDTTAYGESRVIEVLGIIGDHYKRLRVTAMIGGGGVAIEAWEETN